MSRVRCFLRKLGVGRMSRGPMPLFIFIVWLWVRRIGLRVVLMLWRRRRRVTIVEMTCRCSFIVVPIGWFRRGGVAHLVTGCGLHEQEV